MNRYWRLLVILTGVAVFLGGYLTQLYQVNTRRPAMAVESGEAPPVQPAPKGPGEAALLNEAYQLSNVRKLQYQEALDFEKNSGPAINGTWQAQLALRYPSDSLERLGMVYQLLGFVDPLDSDDPIETRYRTADCPSEDCLYDSFNGKFLYTDACDPTKVDFKELLAQQLGLMLLDQQFRWREAQVLPEVQADQALAQEAFVQSDAFTHALRYVKRDPDGSAVHRAAEAYVKDLPAFLQDSILLPFREGLHFCAAIEKAGVSLDAVYQQLPESTSEILHPERYLAMPRKRPRTVTWPQLDQQGLEPTWDNVVGELLVRSLLRRSWASLLPVSSPQVGMAIASSFILYRIVVRNSYGRRIGERSMPHRSGFAL